MKNNDWERFHNGDTAPGGIPIIQIPPKPKPFPVALMVGLAAGAMVVGALVAYVTAGGSQGGQKPVVAKPSRAVAAAPSQSQSEAPPSQTAESKNGEGMTCSGDELPVSSHDTITCATEQEACALGASYVPLTSNCGVPEPGQLIPAGTYDLLNPGDCLRLTSGRYEDGMIMKVECDPMSGVSATVVSVVLGGVPDDFKCYSEDGSFQVFVAEYFSGASNVQTLCLSANDGA